MRIISSGTYSLSLYNPHKNRNSNQPLNDQTQSSKTSLTEVVNKQDELIAKHESGEITLNEMVESFLKISSTFGNTETAAPQEESISQGSLIDTSA
jgi:hypothetical protein